MKTNHVERYTTIIDTTILQAQKNQLVNPRNIILNIRAELDQIVGLAMVTEAEIAHLRIRIDTFLQTL